MMDYLELQMGGDIIKPIKYHIGEWRALNYFLTGQSRNQRILDVGCGVGYGVGMMNLLGFKDVMGIDINPDKITVGKRLGYEVYKQDLLDNPMANWFDIIWCSHAFEHMLDADAALQRLLLITNKKAKFYFILPYPDLDPAPAHCSSSQIGLDMDDEGNSVMDWFEYHGLGIAKLLFDDFREPEIWLEVVKK